MKKFEIAEILAGGLLGWLFFASIWAGMYERSFFLNIIGSEYWSGTVYKGLALYLLVQNAMLRKQIQTNSAPSVSGLKRQGYSLLVAAALIALTFVVGAVK